MSQFTRRLGHILPLKRSAVIRVAGKSLPEYFHQAIAQAGLGRPALAVYSEDFPGMVKSHAQVIRELLEQQYAELKLLREVIAAREASDRLGDAPALLRPQAG